jgi:transposase
MKPLSNDLRTRIVTAYEGTEFSYKDVAARFQVSVSSVRRFVKQWRETGTVTPKAPANGQQPKIRGEGETVLKHLVKTQVAASQEELCECLALEIGTRVSQPTLCRALRRAQITRKKRRNGRRSSSEPMSKRPDNSLRKT